MHYFKSILAAALLSLSVSAFALHAPACPSAAQIKSVKLDNVQKIEGMWMAYSSQPHKFKGRDWFVAVGGFKAHSRAETLKQAQKYQPRLNGPIFSEAMLDDETRDMWGCLYAANGDVLAVAITPLNLTLGGIKSTRVSITPSAAAHFVRR